MLNIYYCPGLPIDRELIRETLTTARVHMDTGVIIHGDRPLLPADDPYNTPVVQGKNCTVGIHSYRFPGTEVIVNRLTYEVTVNVLRGLLGFLYSENHAASAVTEVIDPSLTGTMVTVGFATIRPYQ